MTECVSGFEEKLSGGAESLFAIDSESGINSVPYVTLQPGQEVTFTEGYGVADPGEITLTIVSGFDYVEWAWTTAAGA